MHSLNTKNLVIHFNGDLSGDLCILRKGHSNTVFQREMRVDAMEFLELAIKLVERAHEQEEDLEKEAVLSSSPSQTVTSEELEKFLRVCELSDQDGWARVDDAHVAVSVSTYTPVDHPEYITRGDVKRVVRDLANARQEIVGLTKDLENAGVLCAPPMTELVIQESPDGKVEFGVDALRHPEAADSMFKTYRDALDDICEKCGDCGEEGCACLVAIEALEGRRKTKGTT